MRVFRVYFDDGQVCDAVASTIERAVDMACYYVQLKKTDVTRVFIPEVQSVPASLFN